MTHPNPLTAEKVKADQQEAVAKGRRLSYVLWEGELRCDIAVATCVYGFPSCVILEFSYGSGVKSEDWNSYDIESTDKQVFFDKMFEWLATTITERATGKERALGTFGEIERLLT